VLLGIGIWLKVDERSVASLIKNEEAMSQLGNLAWAIIVIAAVVIILGFLGCCGAIRENQCMLATVIHSLRR